MSVFNEEEALEWLGEQRWEVASCPERAAAARTSVELVARCTDDDQVIWAIHRVALAAVRVADISYTCRP